MAPRMSVERHSISTRYREEQRSVREKDQLEVSSIETALLISKQKNKH